MRVNSHAEVAGAPCRHKKACHAPSPPHPCSAGTARTMHFNVLTFFSTKQVRACVRVCACLSVCVSCLLPFLSVPLVKYQL